MQLIGMLDSPYVRRVAISLQLLGLPFTHRSISVFRAFDQFAAINPVVKAPSLICDDGEVLMDSTLILEYAECLAGSPAGTRQSLMPVSLTERQHALRIIGLALAACDKAIQIIYEREYRPAEKFHGPWIARVTGQLLAAFDNLETGFSRHPSTANSAVLDQAGVSSAVAWHFTQRMLPEVVPAARCPILREFSLQAETLPEFAAAPHGLSTYSNDR